MITHEINKYATEKNYTPVYQYSGVYAPRYNDVRPMGKLEYATYLSTLKFKKGDLVVNTMCTMPYLPDEVLMVADIAEVVHFVTFGGVGIGPRCITVKDHTGKIVPGQIGADTLRKIQFNEAPQAWKEFLSDNT